MTLTFLGTGTSMGVPVAGGFGREAPSTDPRDQRWRTSVWVRTPETSLIIDAGPEFRLQTLRAGIRRIDGLLITHEHTDHVGGIDDLRPFNYVQGGPIPVLTHPRTEAHIHRRFDYMFEPDKTPGSVDLDFLPLGPIRFGDLRVHPVPVVHGNLDILGFRINDLGYVTDASHLGDEAIGLLAGCDTLVLNGLRWEPEHPTHFTIPEAVEMARSIGARRTWLVHMSTPVRHAETDRRLPEGIRLAYDQLTVSVGGPSASP